MATVTQPKPVNRGDTQRRVRHPLDALRGYIRFYVSLEGLLVAILYLAIWFWVALGIDYGCFKLFAFDPNSASLPSGHATNIFAFATVIVMLWPRARVLLYTLAAWIAASRVLIGQHYFTDIALGAILGTAFPYLVRERFAARRWLFEPAPGGGYRIRGVRTQRWLNWPKTGRQASEEARLFGHSGGNSGEGTPK